ncbi:class B sortase [Streptococcus respiraculi]|uniref:class B sortase n=1 Tax=Streptococcus respiraculi TaxID=2021971 RepID=UPI000E7336FD
MSSPLVCSYKSPTTVDKEPEDISISSREVKKQRLFHQNPDVYAWLKVDGTKIDYPVVQHPRDDSYYLSHDVNGAETYYGAIFTELVNTKTFNDAITIIYGHAMTDGTMFGSLQDLSDPSFFNEHRMVTIYTVDKEYHYEILAAHSYTNDHLFSTFELGTQTGIHHYLATLEERALANGGAYRPLPIEKDKDRFLILSTCDALDDNQRYVVTARLTDVKERKNE